MIDLNIDFLKPYIAQYKISDTTFRLTLPFLDRNNDFIELYIIKNKNETYTLTDDGATIADLQLNGFNFLTDKKSQAILDDIVSTYGVNKTKHDELLIHCTMNDLSSKKHMLIQCIIKINDIFYQ